MTDQTVRELITLGSVQNEAWLTSEEHGFHDDDPVYAGYPEEHPANIAYLSMKLMLIVSEASEALEDLRGGNHGGNLGARMTRDPLSLEANKPIGFMSELADIVIRVGDLAAIVGGDLEAAVSIKMKYNKTREHKHGKVV